VAILLSAGAVDHLIYDLHAVIGLDSDDAGNLVRAVLRFVSRNEGLVFWIVERRPINLRRLDPDSGIADRGQIEFRRLRLSVELDTLLEQPGLDIFLDEGQRHRTERHEHEGALRRRIADALDEGRKIRG